MARIVDADTNSLVQRPAGTFTPTDEMYRDSVKAEKLNKRLLARTKAAGAIRGDVDANDIALIFEMIAAVRVTDPVRTAALRHRYLALLLDAMHGLSATPPSVPAPNVAGARSAPAEVSRANAMGRARSRIWPSSQGCRAARRDRPTSRRWWPPS